MILALDLKQAENKTTIQMFPKTETATFDTGFAGNIQRKDAYSIGETVVIHKVTAADDGKGNVQINGFQTVDDGAGNVSAIFEDSTPVEILFDADFKVKQETAFEVGLKGQSKETVFDARFKANQMEHGDSFEVSFGSSLNVDFNSEDIDIYDGSYEVTPAVDEQTLNTAWKYLEKNVVVEPIPYAAVSNTSNGTTVTIG